MDDFTYADKVNAWETRALEAQRVLEVEHYNKVDAWLGVLFRGYNLTWQQAVHLPDEVLTAFEYAARRYATMEAQEDEDISDHVADAPLDALMEVCGKPDSIQWSRILAATVSAHGEHDAMLQALYNEEPPHYFSTKEEL